MRASAQLLGRFSDLLPSSSCQRPLLSTVLVHWWMASGFVDATHYNGTKAHFLVSHCAACATHDESAIIRSPRTDLSTYRCADPRNPGFQSHYRPRIQELPQSHRTWDCWTRGYSSWNLGFPGFLGCIGFLGSACWSKIPTQIHGQIQEIQDIREIQDFSHTTAPGSWNCPSHTEREIVGQGDIVLEIFEILEFIGFLGFLGSACFSPRKCWNLSQRVP